MNDSAGAAPETPIAFLGAGNMAFALVAGLLRHGWAPGDITVSDPADGQRTRFTSLASGVASTSDNRAASATARCVVLAVKPQQIGAVLDEIADVLPADAMVVSIAAGVSLAAIEHALGPDRAIVRSMPNQGAMVGYGATGLIANSACSDNDRALATRILGASGVTHWFATETDLDVVTAIAGSGPAYCYRLLESLVAAAAQRGLDPAVARSLAVATLRGAAELAGDDEISLEALRARVTSPGGTTAAAIDTLDSHGFAAAIDDAVAAAVQRAEQLAELALRD